MQGNPRNLARVTPAPREYPEHFQGATSEEEMVLVGGRGGVTRGDPGGGYRTRLVQDTH